MNSYYQMVTSKPKATQTEIIANETEEERKIREVNKFINKIIFINIKIMNILTFL